MNRLVKETSPYLKQHAHNPVDWYPWGEEALSRARREERPIFLSSGYSACHWCHVMAHESFEDPATAALLNAHFIAIKLDREERPDLDALYMRALLRMQGRGGWPLNLFLTPNLKPFFGGSYFPPERRYGISSFQEVLRSVSQAFRERRAELEEASEELVTEVGRSFTPPPPTGLPRAEAASAATRALLSRFDSVHGGFGAAPKFPQPALLQFLLEESARTGEASLAERVFFSLRKMAAGGVRDQIGGAFHRYSVDDEWHVPHYEKMLYDNAQLAALYFRASGMAREPYFATVGREVLADLSRTMAASGGGFIAALDADSEGEEGRYYLWGPGELFAHLGSEEGNFLAELFHIGEGDALEFSTLHRSLSWEEAGRRYGLPADDVESRVARNFETLRKARVERVAPGADTKLLTDWNALAAVAFLEGFLATDEEAFRETGLDLLHLLDTRAFRGELLYHLFDGEAPRVPGFLSDYAYLSLARWKAFESTGDLEWLSSAEELARTALRRFGRPGGALFETASEAGPDLLLPVREAEDGVLPSSIAVLAKALRHLERHTGLEEWKGALDALLTAESGCLAQAPGAYPLLAGVAAER